MTHVPTCVNVINVQYHVVFVRFSFTLSLLLFLYNVHVLYIYFRPLIHTQYPLSHTHTHKPMSSGPVGLWLVSFWSSDSLAGLIIICLLEVLTNSSSWLYYLYVLWIFNDLLGWNTCGCGIVKAVSHKLKETVAINCRKSVYHRSPSSCHVEGL